MEIVCFLIGFLLMAMSLKKSKTLLITTIIIACLAQGQAQRQEVSERYSVPVDIPMTGTLTYHVIPDGKGENVKDGPLSIRASQKPISAVVNFEKLTISGSYSLDANYRNGQLNGKFSVSTTMNSKSYRSNQTATYTMNGSFLNGKPNGNFTARYKSPNAELNVNYKNGKLVGSYYLKNFVSGYGNRNYKGTLTANGDLTGKWEIEKGTKKETEYHTFINNVRVDYYDNESSTPKDIIEKSKLFAQGKISEKELFEQGYMVFEDEIPLGDYASDVILRSDVVEFKKLGGYDFSDDLTHKYKYLKKKVFLNENGLEVFLKWIKESIQYPFSYGNGNFYRFGTCPSDVSRPEYTEYIGIDERGEKYVLTGHSELTTASSRDMCQTLYCCDKIYLSDEQFKTITESLEQFRREEAWDLKEFMDKTKKYAYEEQQMYYRIWNMESDQLKYDEITMMEKILKDVHFDTMETTADKQFFLFPLTGNRNILYVSQKALETRDAMLEKLKQKKHNIVSGLFKQGYFKEIEVDLNNDYMEHPHILPIIDNLNFLIEKSAFSIAYDEQAPKRFNPEGMASPSLWQSDLNNAVKKLTKITHIKITGIDGNTVHCEFTRKKKFIYQIDIEFKDGKIMATSLDFEKATILQKL